MPNWTGFRLMCVIGVLIQFSGGSGSASAIPPEEVARGLRDDRGAFFASGTAEIRDLEAGDTAGPSYPSSNVTLLSRVSLGEFGPFGSANDVWGYVSPSGREYAILGLQSGTGFVEITDPTQPDIVGVIPDSNSIWSDMKTYQQYAYNANESGGGIQVIALSMIDQGIVTLAASVQSGMLQTSHTLALNEASGFLYLCGSNLSGGRLAAYSLATPRTPTIAGTWSDAGSRYVHAAQVVTYTEGTYAGREIAFCYCGRDGFRIVDVTNKSNMFTMGTLFYPNASYCHQGWLSEDWKHVFINDELDESELPTVNTTTTYVVNVENLSNPLFATSFTNGLPSIDHNLMVRGHYVYEANYTSGLRVYDVADLGSVQQTGFLDTYPSNNNQNFNGAWGVYSGMPSKVVLASDQSSGLFVLDVAGAADDSCLVPAVAQKEPNAPLRNRYLSVKPGNPGRITGIRVVLADLPPGMDAFEGQEMWVDEPVFHPSGLVTARLRCDPWYRDWSDVNVVHITGEEIVPGAGYEVQTAMEECVRGPQLRLSAPKTFNTASTWGDVASAAGFGQLDDTANFSDISAIVGVFISEDGPSDIVTADLSPGVPNQKVNFIDIASAADAFRNIPYSYLGPSVCP